MGFGAEDINIIVDTGFQLPGDDDLFFGPLDEGEMVEHRPAHTSLPDVLVEAGVFSSKSQARKAGFGPVDGWFDKVIGKKRVRVCFFKPIELSPGQ